MNCDFKYFDNHKNIYIFVGAYGSGKSEVSVNSAFTIKEKSDPKRNIILADLDIINPFFRSADAAKELEKEGITLLSPVFANTNSEVPAVPAEINSVFDSENTTGILDIGGEDLGARIVSSLRNKIKQVNYDLLMVVNTKRPCTDSGKKILSVMDELETTCGLEVTGVINNTNLLEFSEINDLLESNEMIKTAAREKNIPMAFCSAMENIVPAFWNNKTPQGDSIMRLRKNIFYYKRGNFI